MQLLTKLLNKQKPDGFRAPPCLGYVKLDSDHEESQFGLVFLKPAASASDSLITLRDLLEQQQKPSLSARMSLCALLAKCLSSFHAVNWLHKGLRSSNVVFFATSNRCPDYSVALVSGFELSRPHNQKEMTERPVCRPEEDIYRHPQVQYSQSNGNFRKYHDIYSLAIVLIEIAVWNCVDKFLGYGDLAAMKPSELYKVKHSLLEDPARIEQIRQNMGDEFVEVIKICFAADEVEGAIYDEESDGSIGARLQRVLDEDVLGRLKTMELALKA
jgi:hypothetical protein